MSIEGRALSGTLVGVASFVVNALTTFVLVPVLLGAWGPERYGIWLAFNALMGLVVTLDGGHQAYVGNELAKLYFGDRSALRLVLASALWTAVAIGLFVLTVVTALDQTALLPKALGLSASAVANERLDLSAIVWTLGWVLSGSVGGVLIRLLPPAGKFVQSTLWGIASIILRTAAIGCSALLGLRILGATVASILVVLLHNAVFFYYSVRQFPDLLPPRRPSARIGATNFAHSLVLTGSNTLVQLQQNGLNLLVTGALGAAVLPVFSTARTVASTFLQAANVLCAPLAPEMVRFHVNRQTSKLHATFEVNWFLGGTVIQIGILASLPFLPPLYSLWTRHSLPFQPELFALLAAAVGLRAFGSPLQTYLTSVNHLRALTSINVTQTIAVLATTFFGIRWLGLNAAALGVLAGEAIGSVVLPTAFLWVKLSGPWRPRFLWSVALALAQVGASGVAMGLYTSGHAGTTALLLGMLPVLMLSWAQWRRLPDDVQTRISRLFRPNAKLST